MGYVRFSSVLRGHCGGIQFAPALRMLLLRWTFRRLDKTLVCELGLTGSNSAYELRMDPLSDPASATPEVFDDAVAVFARHDMFERTLVEGGWSLEGFEAEALLPN